ncbi:TonB-dependent receptor domain-containing protein [Novosphingobium sp.]|uniref:TonB-dependent receptor domain-containing protein n=1 Tax=Novosphingobium sp. TaxID=1874826 RepID=UPI00286E75D2|nr:TonB-dependent receptor [Novosphingobium sp.]
MKAITTFRAGVARASLALALTLPVAAQAQNANEDDKSGDPEIVVTGTNIRGQAPVGSNSISLGESKLEEIGAQSSNELLASIPQVTNYFNRVPIADLGIAVNQIQISRPNIRNLSSPNAASSPTLILVDGHRVASAGVNQASVDPDLIPTGAIARVDVVTEGGSAIYGADAVAGVINFVTHKRYDGIKVGGHYGFADNYQQWDGSITAGKTWDAGSAWIAYSYTKSDPLYGRDRDYIRNVDWSVASLPGRDLNCAQPNLAVNTVINATGGVFSSNSYAFPGLVAGTANRCDLSEDATIVPQAERHGVTGGLTWDFGDRTSIDVRAYWSQRKTHASSILNASVNINGNNPTVASSLPAGVALGPGILFGFLPVTTVAAVNFSFEPLLGKDSQRSDTLIRQWGGNAELKHDLTDDWQLRGLLNWSQSDSRFELTGVSSARLNAAGAPAAAATAANSFNPFNLASNSPALIKDITDSMLAGQAIDRLLNARLIAEGKLLELPGGDVRVAMGYEFMNDKLQKRFGNDIRIGTLGSLAYTPYSRDVHSLFGEMVLPLISDGNGGSMLTLSAQGRYDHYSDFGSTFNPKIGATFKPASWLTIRGNWGTSFTAPTPLDQLGSLSGSISFFPFVPFVKPGTSTLAGTNNTIAFQGSQPNLKPQEADTWSIGVDIEPMDGLRVSANYYNVKFTNILGTPTPGTDIFINFPSSVAYDVNGLTNSQISSFFGTLAPALQSQLTAAIASAGGGRIVELVDFRVGNFGVLKVEGIDFALNYQHKTDWGGFDMGMNFNAPLKRTQQASPIAPEANQLVRDTSKLQFQLTTGLDIGKFRAQATWNHSAGYPIALTTALTPQSEVDSFNTLNLFFKYDVPGDGMFKDLSFTLNINNVTDAEPPVLRRNGQAENGFANGFTLGRMFILGASKKF